MEIGRRGWLPGTIAISFLLRSMSIRLLRSKSPCHLCGRFRGRPRWKLATLITGRWWRRWPILVRCFLIRRAWRRYRKRVMGWRRDRRSFRWSSRGRFLWGRILWISSCLPQRYQKRARYACPNAPSCKTPTPTPKTNSAKHKTSTGNKTPTWPFPSKPPPPTTREAEYW